ncbi:alpha-galactosidase [bacterium]|nr:MAG: alpha-galactosidase [bacterium]
MPIFAFAPPVSVSLESLDLKPIRQEWGEPKAARSVDGNPLRIAGTTYASGLGVHARFEMRVALNGRAERFTAKVGVDDEAERPGSVRFLVYADRQLLSDSGVKRSGEAATTFDVNLKGKKELRLIVEDAGDGVNYDHADWADAIIVGKAGAKFRTVTIPVEKGMPIASHKRGETEIHGARIVGATPGREFIYRIPASGTGELTYTAEGLPAGIGLDKRGVISGRIAEAGTYDVKLTVKGRRGTARRVLRLVAGKDKLALTPPMGWNSWNVWGLNLDADKIRAAADSFVKAGLANYGYRYVNIDDAWEADQRDANGLIWGNERFGDMKAITDYIHSQGLLAGLYSSPGPRTCGNYLGSYQHELQDAQQYAKWGFDYLKYDWCSYGGIAPDPDLAAMKKPYALMQQALASTDRDIFYSLCQYGMGDVWKWGREVGGNAWRTTGDVNDSWGSVSDIGFAEPDRKGQAGPGAWNDPDMLVVGVVGWGSPHPTKLTPNEQIAHMTMWSMAAAPLLAGCDLTALDDWTKDLLLNHEMIEIDQDPMGVPARRIYREGDREVWARPLYDGTMAVAMFNRGEETTEVKVDLKQLGFTGAQPVLDCWRRRGMGSKEELLARIPRHGAVMYRVGKGQAPF